MLSVPYNDNMRIYNIIIATKLTFSDTCRLL